MTNTGVKIVSLKDYQQLRQRIQSGDSEAVFDGLNADVLKLEAKALELFSSKHKQKRALELKNWAIGYEYSIMEAIRILESQASKANDDKKIATLQTTIKQFERLLAQNDRIKKNIADDISDCRYEEGRRAVDPVKAVGFIIGTPYGLANLVRIFITDKPDTVWRAGEAGVVIGVVFAFHHQAKNLCKNTIKAIAQSAENSGALKKSPRRFAFAATLAASVATKPSSEIATKIAREKPSIVCPAATERKKVIRALVFRP